MTIRLVIYSLSALLLFFGSFYRNLLLHSRYIFSTFICISIYLQYLYTRLQGPQSPNEFLLFVNLNTRYSIFYNTFLSQGYTLDKSDIPSSIYQLFITYLYEYITYITPTPYFVTFISFFQFLLYLIAITIFSTYAAAFFSISSNILYFFCCVNIYAISSQADLNPSGIMCSLFFLFSAIIFDQTLLFLYKLIFFIITCIFINLILPDFIYIILFLFLYHFRTDIFRHRRGKSWRFFLILQSNYLYFVVSIIFVLFVLIFMYININFLANTKTIYLKYLEFCSAQFHNIIIRPDNMAALSHQAYSPYVIFSVDDLLTKLFVLCIRISPSTYLTSVSPIYLFLSVFYTAVLLSIFLSYLLLNNIVILLNILCMFLLSILNNISDISVTNIFTNIISIFSFIFLYKTVTKSENHKYFLCFLLLFNILLIFIIYRYEQYILDIQFGYDTMYEQTLFCSK